MNVFRILLCLVIAWPSLRAQLPSWAVVAQPEGKPANRTFQGPLYQQADRVLQQLLHTLETPPVSSPRLELTNGRQFGMTMDRGRQVITLETDALQACLSETADSARILANLLAVPVTVYFLEADTGRARLPFPDFAAATDRLFRAACLVAAAGYEPDSSFLHLTASLYRAYHLPDTLAGFLSLPAQRGAAREALDSAQSFSPALDHALWTLALQETSLADLAAQFPLPVFYRLAGISAAKTALETFTTAEFPYALPFDDLPPRRAIVKRAVRARPEYLNRALALLENAARLNPKSAETDWYLALVHLLTGNQDKVNYFLRRSELLGIDKLSKEGRANLLLLRGILRHREGALETARQFFDQAEKLGNAAAQLNLSRLYADSVAPAVSPPVNLPAIRNPSAEPIQKRVALSGEKTLYFAKTDSSTTYTLQDRRGRLIHTLQVQESPLPGADGPIAYIGETEKNLIQQLGEPNFRYSYGMYRYWVYRTQHLILQIHRSEGLQAWAFFSENP